MTDQASKPLLEQNDLDSLWNPQNAVASETAFRGLLPYAKERSATDSTFYIEVLTQIARAEAAQGKLDDAGTTLASAEKLLLAEKPAFQTAAKIRWQLERGRLYILQKTPSQARALFGQAWALAVQAEEDFFTIDVAQMMAMIEPQKSQQEWILKGIQIAEESKQPKAKRWLGPLHASLAWKLYDLLQYESAERHFQKSLSYFQATGTEREIFVAKWSMGKLLRRMNRLEEALAMQKALLAELGAGGITDGRLYEEIAECLQALKQTDEAQGYFELAYHALSSEQWISDNQPLKLKRLKDLGRVRTNANKP